jgi:hypothetical protein
VCAAAAGGVLTSFGVATIGIEPWFVPVVAVLLLIGLWGFWQSAQMHRKIWPFLIAIVSSGAVVTGRMFEIPVVLWGATAALSAAYISDWLIKKSAAS